MGFLIAVINAFTVSGQDVLLKKLKGENTFFLIWLRMAAALPILALLVTLFAEWRIPPAPFWWLVLGVSLPIEIAQFYIGITAIQRSPLSLIAPLGSATSIFLIPAGYFVLGEVPARIAVVGILAIVVGAFVLGWRVGETRRLAESLRNVFSEPGSWLVLTSAALVSISIVVLKRSFTYASPHLTAFYIVAALALALTPLAFLRPSPLPAERRGQLFVGLSFLSGASLGLHYFGLSLLPAAYFISVKRTSMLWNVLFGRLFFGEGNIRERFFGALLMVAGVILIALG